MKYKLITGNQFKMLKEGWFLYGNPVQLREGVICQAVVDKSETAV
jgi:hypothetical protein